MHALLVFVKSIEFIAGLVAGIGIGVVGDVVIHWHVDPAKSGDDFARRV